MIINPDTKICSRDVPQVFPNNLMLHPLALSGIDGDKNSEVDDQGSASESSGSESTGSELEEGLSRDNSDEELEGVVDKPSLAARVGEISRDQRGSEQGN